MAVKNIIGFLLVFCIFAVGAELMAEEDYSGVGPTIKNFVIKKEGDNLRLSFSFFNVKGGLAAANFTVGYAIERGESIIESNVMTNLGIAPDLAKVAKSSKTMDILKVETGEFQVIVPWLRARTIKDLELKSGDKIKYLIYLTDKNGRKSNTVFCEYLFIEEWNI